MKLCGFNLSERTRVRLDVIRTTYTKPGKPPMSGAEAITLMVDGVYEGIATMAKEFSDASDEDAARHAGEEAQAGVESAAVQAAGGEA